MLSLIIDWNISGSVVVLSLNSVALKQIIQIIIVLLVTHVLLPASHGYKLGTASFVLYFNTH